MKIHRKRNPKYPRIPTVPAWVLHKVFADLSVISKCTRCMEPESDMVPIMQYQHKAFIDKHSHCVAIPEWITQFVYVEKTRVLRCERCKEESGRISVEADAYRLFIKWHNGCDDDGKRQQKEHSKKSIWKSPFTGEPEDKDYTNVLRITETAYLYFNCIIGGAKGLEEIAHGYFGKLQWDGTPIEHRDKMHQYLRTRSADKKPQPGEAETFCDSPADYEGD